MSDLIFQECRQHEFSRSVANLRQALPRTVANRATHIHCNQCGCHKNREGRCAQ